MSFLAEINELLGVSNLNADLFITFVPSKGAIIQGYKKLLEITDNRLIVLGKNKRKIEVLGINLEIFSLAPSEIVVHGKIVQVGELNE